MKNNEAFKAFCFKGAKIFGSSRKELTPRQQKVYNLSSVGWDAAQIASRTGMKVSCVYDAMLKAKNNGWT
ncbi:MAG: DNA-binding NarL/FixJ family response regulator [Halieaceae bacterium]|jgi:DNA-binding NarL/FixJ family response regulator